MFTIAPAQLDLRCVQPRLPAETSLYILLSLSESGEEFVSIEIEEARLRIEADPEKGFQWHYYLSIPSMNIAADKEIYLLVAPNNSGSGNDNTSFHDESVCLDAFDSYFFINIWWQTFIINNELMFEEDFNF